MHNTDYYAIVTTYSWGAEPSVELFHSFDDAVNRLETIANEEYRVDVEDNENTAKLTKIDDYNYSLTVYYGSGNVDTTWFQLTSNVTSDKPNK